MKRTKLGCFGWLGLLILGSLAIKYPIPALAIGGLGALGIYLWVRKIRSNSEPKWNGDYPPGTLNGEYPTRVPKVEEASPKNDKSMVQSSGPRLAFGPEFDVVGESFYADNFHKLRALLGAEPEDEEYIDLELLNEPENKFSANGHAVAVLAAGMKIGHISESENTPFFKLIASVGGKVNCAGRVWFDEPGGTIERNSVQLLVKLPPKIAKN